MLENAAESHTSGARFVGQPAGLPERWLKKDTTTNTPNFYTQLFLAMAKKYELPRRQITKSDNQPKNFLEDSLTNKTVIGRFWLLSFHSFRDE